MRAAGEMMGRPPFTEVATLGDVLLRAAQERPERAALILPGQSATFAELSAAAARVGRSLAALGVKPGQHVALLIPNCTEFAAALFGIALIGGVAVPLSVRNRATELRFIIANSQAVALITSSHPDDPVDFVAILAEALPASEPARAPELRHRLLIRGEGSGDFTGAADFLSLSEQVSEDDLDERRRRIRVRDPALIIYTSGTTANPKGCVLSHEAATRGPVERSRYRLGVGDHDVSWGAGPLFHIGSLAPFIGSIGAAGTYLTDTHFEPGRALRLMEEHGVTLAWPWFSAIVQGLIDHPTFEATKLDRLRFLLLIAPPTLVDRVYGLFPRTEVLQACGMTETGGIFAICGSDEDRLTRTTTNGKPSPGIEVRIVDPTTGVDLPDGEIGEIWVRGYNLMERYWDAPEKTAECLTRDGWLKTGDLYTRLPNGSLVFQGRCKDMLKVGGENVAAVEVESFLCTHPAVKTAEVVGRPDARLDEVPVAFIELNPDMAANEAELIAHCKGKIANYKVPRAIHFVAPQEWPMSATKIDKRALRARLQEMSE
ncbi:MAG: class I adenylate-forming enzyme family protein [Sphingomicrobium sp.]